MAVRYIQTHIRKIIRLFLNALAASAGGGITYVRNVLPHLGKHPDVQTTVALTPALRRDLSTYPNVDFLECKTPAHILRRFLFEQRTLPELISAETSDVLISAGNFALRNSPVPQVLLSRNSLYTSRAFNNDLFRRRHYALWLDTKIKGAFAARSVRWADVTVAPSLAFAKELRNRTGIHEPGRILAIHHGFDADAFHQATPGDPPRELAATLARRENTLRLLFVSHYNYYRNFETLLKGIALLRERLPDQLRLFLTCKLDAPEHAGSYRASSASKLVDELGIRSNVQELGSVPYSLLHHVYRACDIYVSPAYAETFAHPLVEAMSSGLPIVASDLPVHREICGDAAVYFPPFSPEALAQQIENVTSDSSAMEAQRARAILRSGRFSWARHVESILQVCCKLTQRNE